MGTPKLIGTTSLNLTTTPTTLSPPGGSGDWLAEWADSRIPKRFRHATLDNFDPQNESQRKALELAQEWVEGAMRGEGPMLAFAGPQGTGKSHLLYGTAMLYAERVMELRKTSQSSLRLPRLEPWYRLADVLRYSDDRDTVRASIYGAQVVMIDEVRPTSGTNFDDTELAKLACHAYDQQVAVLITSNVHPLDKVMGAPAADRFTVHLVTGDSRR